MKPAQRIAIVSDLHIGKGARCKELCPDPAHHESIAVSEDFHQRLLSHLKNLTKRSRKKIDYLILPGDVTHAADPHEFKFASDFVQGIMDCLNITQERVFFVPGNHDVDWSVLRKSDPTGHYRSTRYAPLLNDNWVFNNIINRAKGSLTNSPYHAQWETDDLIVIGYNSSWHDDAEAPIHYGNIADEHITSLKSVLSKLKRKDKRYKIFLAHHHPVSYSSAIPNYPDFSAMQNAEKLLDALITAKFDFFIHGHRHEPKLTNHVVDFGFPLTIVSSGSLSVRLENPYAGTVLNQLHILNLHGRDKTSGIAFGQLDSWAYAHCKGWCQSVKDHHGIDFDMPFGPLILPASLEELLSKEIKKQFARNNCITLSDFKLGNSKLKYVPASRVVESLQALRSEFNLRIHGNAPIDMVLIKD